MAEDKEQTLANLYSLRAGISAVATQRNKVEAINNQTAEEVANLEGEIRSLNYDNRNLKTNLEKNNSELKRRQECVKSFRERDVPSRKKYDTIKSIYRAIKITLWSLVVFYIVYAVIYLPIFSNVVSYDWVEATFIPLIVIAALIIQGILYFTLGYKVYKEEDSYEHKDMSYKAIKKEIEKDQQLIKRLESENEVINHKISDNEALIAEKQKEIEMRKTAAEKACVPYYQLGGMIQEQFENQFDRFLNLRDWKNVDIIIFAYESGRVDTMREALTYADGETRADRIVNAINASTRAICRSIESGLHTLALSMGKCFSVISQQIAEQTRKLDKISVNIENLSANTARLAESTASYSENLANLAAKVDYSNALQEQRNKSSQELVEKNEVFMLEARNYMDDIYNNRR